MNELVIGTRGSPLAMWQADYVRKALLREHPDLRIRLQPLRTSGDVSRAAPPGAIGDTGIFTREIERALLAGSVDLAVHSLKDLPTRLPEGLALGAVPAREDPADAVIAKDGLALAKLPPGAPVMTGSVRRKAQLLHRRPDLIVRPVRGNVQTRVRKLEESDAAATVLACAGLVRLGLGGRITERLEPADFVPACGQGALAVEIRADDARLAELCRALDDCSTREETRAERSLLAALAGGCRAPIGAYARFTDTGGKLAITGMVAALDGSRLVRRTISRRIEGPDEADALGRELAEALRAAGGGAILQEVMSQSAQGPEGGT